MNGKKVSREGLAAGLKATSELNPLPVMQIKFAPGVDCDTVISLRRLMAQTLDCGFGHCAEGDGKWWRIGDVVFPGTPNEPYDPDASPSSSNN
ncbi:MAG: hypothetical protein JSR79_10780 [Proteobacteria bacterium]|nr:hypothetical protein [Pseudomonadota bacterium]